jgi:predicted DNA-binding transcriptional regulator YafY
MKLQEYADTFGVSRRTVDRRLATLENLTDEQLYTFEGRSKVLTNEGTELLNNYDSFVASHTSSIAVSESSEINSESNEPTPLGFAEEISNSDEPLQEAKTQLATIDAIVRGRNRAISEAESTAVENQSYLATQVESLQNAIQKSQRQALGRSATAQRALSQITAGISSQDIDNLYHQTMQGFQKPQKK